MIPRLAAGTLTDRLKSTPAVVLVGSRQVGKTTLALSIADEMDCVYLDMESPSDRLKLNDPERYLSQHRHHLVILDEIHRAPGLFPVLRGQIDHARRSGRRNGLYLLLGSASVDLLRQSGESLAGRVTYLELPPFQLQEVGTENLDLLWIRGGYPESFLQSSNDESLRWRLDFIQTYLERDLPQFGATIPVETMRRLWTMLAHLQGGLYNAAAVSRGLGIDVRTLNRYVDLLVDLYLIRRLEPWHANLGKRLIKSPKLYVRDSGLLHALLGIDNSETLYGHPVVGASWEGFVIEQIVSVVPERTSPAFFRTVAGAEVDLLLSFPDGSLWAVEVKRGLDPRPSRGFHGARDDLNVTRQFVVYPGHERFQVTDTVEAVPLPQMLVEVQSL